MNKKLLLILGLVVFLFSIVGCGDKESTIESETYVSTDNTKDSSNSLQEITASTTASVKEEVQPDASFENFIENSLQEQEAVPVNQNEAEYYTIIKDAWQRQKDYIASVEDFQVKQSLQTTRSAAFGEANSLMLKYLEDTEIIEAQLQKVLDGE